jgi:OOP family OmpA-OmpF porin
MKRYKIFSLVGAMMLVLSGCVGQLVDTDSVKKMKTTGNAFQSVLHKEYTSLAIARNLEWNYVASTYFLKRARMAATGKDFPPQPMAERKNISAGAKAELAKARLNLTKMLWNGAADSTPAAAAKAQVMYDCWLEAQDDNTRPNNIAGCRAGFEKAYAMLQPVLKKALVPLPTPFIVYFASDSAKINGKGMVKIKQAYADYRLYKPGKVWVAGHTDSKGSKAHNRALSRHRANAVANALMELGVPRKAIKKANHGEVSQVKPTKDKVSEAMNRRVSIFFMR